MAFSFHSNAPLPKGFSVYQPALGAQLQFFPSLGSQELDDMVNAFIPGPASIQEKRATISLSFLEHAHLTGQTFKFYPVPEPSSASTLSPLTSNSSFSASPASSSSPWDFGMTASGSASVSPRSSSTPSQKYPKTTPRSRPATDFSHIPGMKIMTKDGLDVTNSASRGSKTKEQRDHAHLMRIIKACDNCRRKKIRCDPSHKKRPISHAQPSHPASKPAKKARTKPQKPSITEVPPVDDALRIPESEFLFEPTFSFADLDAFALLDSAAQPGDPWEEFVQYPPVEVDDNYDFFLDPEGYLSSQSPSSSSSSEATQKSLTPSSQQDLLAVPGDLDGWTLNGGECSPQFPYMDASGSSTSYTDFNLFSPDSSTLTEDELMLPVSSNRDLGPSQLSSDSADSPDFYHRLDGNGGGGGGMVQPNTLSASASPPTAWAEMQPHALDWYISGSSSAPQSHNGGGSGLESNLAASLLSGKTILLERDTPHAGNLVGLIPTRIGGLGRQTQVDNTSWSSSSDGIDPRLESASQLATFQEHAEVREDVSKKPLTQAARIENSAQSTWGDLHGQSPQPTDLSPSTPGHEHLNDPRNEREVRVARVQSVVLGRRADVSSESPGDLDERDQRPLDRAARQNIFAATHVVLGPCDVDESTVQRIGDSGQEGEIRPLEGVMSVEPEHPQTTKLHVIETMTSHHRGVIPDATTSTALSTTMVLIWTIFNAFFCSWVPRATEELEHAQTTEVQATEVMKSHAQGRTPDTTPKLVVLSTMVLIWTILDAFSHAWLLQAATALLFTLTSLVDYFALLQGPKTVSHARRLLGGFLCQMPHDHRSREKGDFVSTAFQAKESPSSALMFPKSWTLGRFAPLVMG